jgi:tetratricopeptide (TPR) repeat protein
MGIFTPLTSLIRKGSDFQAELKRYRAALQRNPSDLDLRFDLIKFILLNRFTDPENAGEHIQDALRNFESIAGSDLFDFQCHYLVGKYYQEAKDIKNAYRVYLRALKRFNETAARDVNLRAEHNELAYSVALNLMTLQHDPVDPEVEKCFKIIRRSFPMHLKRIEYEHEMGKPAPDRARIKQLVEEIKKLRAEEEAEAGQASVQAPTPVPEKKEAAPKQALSAAEEMIEREKKIAAARANMPTISRAGEKEGDKRTEAPQQAAAPVEKVPEKKVETPVTPAPAPKPTQEGKGLFSPLFSQMAPEKVGLKGSPVIKLSGKEDGIDSDSLTLFGSFEAGDKMFMAFHNDQWEGPFAIEKLKEMHFLQPDTWVCRAGSQMVMQAYEAPELRSLLGS